MELKALARWRLPLAFALAPLLALSACDQVKNVLDRLDKSITHKEASGPVALSTVALEARAMAGKIQPMDQRAATIAPDPILFVPGDVIVGAKVEDKVMELAPPSMRAALRAQFAVGARPAPIDPDLARRATEAAVSDATRDARTVLDRLGVDATVNAGPGGMLKINLNPEKAAPLQLSASGPSAVPPAPAAPTIAQDTGQKCPKGVTEAQLDADLALKTQCAIERLKSARQFEYVEKNYVISVGSDLPSLPMRVQDAPLGTTPVAPPAAPAAPAPSTIAASSEAVTMGSLPDDPLYAFQWDLRPRGAGAGNSPGGAGFADFWVKARQTGSRDVRVAIIDTGIDKKHPDFAASANIAPGIDLVADATRSGDGDGVDTNPNDEGDHCAPSTADSFHGSHVAGTIGAAVTNDKKGIASAAWNVTIIPVRAIGRCGGSLEDIVNAVRWSAGLAPAQTASGELITNQTPADVINMSLSVGIPCPESLQAAIDDAVARGTLVVVAAGNKASDAKLYAPGNCANVIAVAANDEKGNLAYYSNFGPNVSVLAPGGDIFADRDNDGRPDGILSTRTTANDCFDPQTGLPAQTCYYSYLQGTSMAAPHVTAALALLKAQLHVSGKQLEDAFMTRALTPIDPNQCGGHDCGRGMLDMSRAALQP